MSQQQETLEFKVSPEMIYLRKLIQLHLNVDVVEEKRRFRPIVTAKMIYTKILNDSGYGPSAIAKSISMNHATSIHYLRNMDGILKTDKNLSMNYKVVNNEYLKEFKPEEAVNLKTFSEENIELKLEVKKLKETIFELRKITSRIQKKSKFEKIFKMIKERTRIGDEELVFTKINRMFNGM